MIAVLCSRRWICSNGSWRRVRKDAVDRSAAASVLDPGVGPHRSRLSHGSGTDRRARAVWPHAFGQSLLLARRLVQAGVPVVQANMGIVQNWDSHSDNFGRLRNVLLPPLDQGVSALLDDLDASGLLDDTLVMMLGEFGRTPRISRSEREQFLAATTGRRATSASLPAPACAVAR